jgi:LPXTG-motif cell wall-anchored protein
MLLYAINKLIKDDSKMSEFVKNSDVLLTNRLARAVSGMVVASIITLGGLPQNVNAEDCPSYPPAPCDTVPETTPSTTEVIETTTTIAPPDLAQTGSGIDNTVWIGFATFVAGIGAAVISKRRTNSI